MAKDHSFSTRKAGASRERHGLDRRKNEQIGMVVEDHWYGEWRGG